MAAVFPTECKAELKTSEAWYREDISFDIIDPDGWRGGRFWDVYWHFVPISQSEYFLRKRRCSVAEYGEASHKSPLERSEKTIYYLWNFLRDPVAQFLVKTQKWKLEFSEEEKKWMEKWDCEAICDRSMQSNCY